MSVLVSSAQSNIYYNSGVISASTYSIFSLYTAPVLPSILIQSNSFLIEPSGNLIVFYYSSITIESQPHTHVLPIYLATTAA